MSGDAATVLGDENAQKYYFGKRFDASSIIESKGAFQSQIDAAAAAAAASAAAADKAA